ncbi:glycosyltransferase family 4 protein [Anoxybacillus ayderensis]|uniref:glycosyltransferase family 4 protein n=1 Tax=Anoxybacillus ayderensis TaxID=265546 RepID=UPI0015EBA1B3|nr:glycosyltransferase family 4 protein [Anoxybacillus ayderensis]
MRLKIWILNHVALKPNEKGITRHYDLAKEMVKDGHDVTIFASSFLAYLFKWRDPNRKNYREDVNGVIYEWMWTFPYYGNGPRRLLNMISYFFMSLYRGMKLKERPDVIVGSSVHLFACLSAYFLSKWKKCTYIVEIRDLWPRTLIDFGAISEKHPVAIMFGLIERFVYKKSERIIVTLPGAYKYITSLGIPKEKIHYIPNGIDLERKKELNNHSSLEEKIREIRKKHKKIAMYVGAHGIANSLPTIIQSAQYVDSNEIAYVFIGEGPEKNKLMEMAKPFNNIYFFDGIPKNEVLSTLALADVLLVSMLKTNLYKYGISLNKLNDYLLAGKPILFAGHVFNNIVAEAHAGLTVEPENPKAFADGVIQLAYLDEKQKLAIQKSSYEYLLNNHDIKKLAKRFVAVCQGKEHSEG